MSISPVQLDHCKKILHYLKTHKNAWPFLEPVDPVALNIPDYPEIIKNPMDLSSVEERLDNGEYASIDDFAEDLRLIWANAERYNGPQHQVTKMGKQLGVLFEKRFQTIKKKEKDANEKTTRGTPSKQSSVVPGTLKVKTKMNIQDMSYEEKRQLCLMINNLDGRHLGKVVQIIYRGMPEVFKVTSQDTEIEINVESLDPATLRELEKYAKSLQT